MLLLRHTLKYMFSFLKKWLGKAEKQPVTRPAPLPTNVTHKVFFSPGEECMRAIIQALGNARQTADICVFTISDDRISKEIIACAKKGIKVRIITDNEKLYDTGSDIMSFEQAGIPVKIDMTEHHMHHKYMVVDGKKILTGSYNWTRSAALNNHENLIMIEDTRVATHFQDNFNTLWLHTVGLKK